MEENEELHLVTVCLVLIIRVGLKKKYISIILLLKISRLDLKNLDLRSSSGLSVS